jgi:hypothetical protein
MHFSCMGQCSLGLLRLLPASAFTSESSVDFLQRCQVSKAQVDATIIAANSSCLPQIKRSEPKVSEPWHSSLLKYHWPHNLKEVTGYKAWERTSTNNESPKCAKDSFTASGTI